MDDDDNDCDEDDDDDCSGWLYIGLCLKSIC